jgi:hypothetical protein
MRRNDLKYHQGLKIVNEDEENIDRSFVLDLLLVITAIVAVVFLVVIFEPEIRGIFRMN